MSDARPILSLPKRPTQQTVPTASPHRAAHAVQPREAVVLQHRGHSASDGFVRGTRPAFAAPLTARPVAFLPKTQPLPRSFEAAVEDPNYASIDPSRMPIPPALLKQLEQSQRILIVSHVHPDNDAVGSALTLARALRVLGKTVEICIDDELTASQRKLDTDNDVKRASQLQGQKWDLAITVDVASLRRIGGARELVKNARAKASVDHHPADADARSDMVMAYGSHATSWRDDGIDASAIQVSAIASRLLADKKLDPLLLRKIYTPALSGMCTDTDWGRRRDLDPLTPHVFKYVLRQSGLDLLQLKAAFDVPTPPTLLNAIDDARGPVKRLMLGQGEAALAVVKVDKTGMRELLHVARTTVPTFTDLDLMNALKTDAKRYVRQGQTRVVLAVEREGHISLSARSSDGSAQRLMQALNGNGHGGAAAASVYGCGLDEAIRRLTTVARQTNIIR